MTDKRIFPAERGANGACVKCGRRHIHRDDCVALKRRGPMNDGAGLSKPTATTPYANGEGH